MSIGAYDAGQARAEFSTPIDAAQPHGIADWRVRVDPTGGDRTPQAGKRPRLQWSDLVLWLLPLPLVLLLVLPLVALGWRALTEGALTGDGSAALREAMVLTLKTSLISTVLIVVTGLPLAYLLARREFTGRRALDVVVDLPIVLPPSVAGIALLLAFGRNGVIGRWFAEAGLTIGFTTAAVVLAQCFVSAPFFVRASAASLQRVQQDMEDVAADLGASPWARFRTVTLPIALPGILAGVVLAWARAVGEFGATIMFAGNFPGVTRTMPLAIYSAYGGGDIATAVILAAALLAAAGLTLGGVRWAAGREQR